MNGATVSRTEDVRWPERQATKKPGFCRRLFTWFQLMGVTQLLSIICVMLSAVVVGLGLVLGGAVLKSSDQGTRISNLVGLVNEQQTRIDEQQSHLDELQNQLNSLERTVMAGSAPR